MIGRLKRCSALIGWNRITTQTLFQTSKSWIRVLQTESFQGSDWSTSINSLIWLVGFGCAILPPLGSSQVWKLVPMHSDDTRLHYSCTIWLNFQYPTTQDAKMCTVPCIKMWQLQDDSEKKPSYTTEVWGLSDPVFFWYPAVRSSVVLYSPSNTSLPETPRRISKLGYKVPQK